jgi:hypothetical protein
MTHVTRVRRFSARRPPAVVLLWVIAGALTAAWQPPPGQGSRPAGGDFRLLDYGAVCDGHTNDHDAIQAAANAADAAGGGTIVWPARTCATAQTVVLGGHADHQSFIGIRGAGSAVSRLAWTGGPTGTALELSHNKYFSIRGLGVFNGPDRGTTTGILLTGPLTVGTQTLGGIFEQVAVSGFHVGIQAGQRVGRAASEILYTSLTLASNDIGWQNDDWNTLNHVFQMLQLGQNGIGLNARSGNFYVDGGSGSNARTAEFRISGAGATYAIRNFRDEDGRRFLVVSNLPTSVVTVEDCLVYTAAPDDIAIEMALSGATASLRDNVIAGKVYLSGTSNLTLSMVDNHVHGDDAVPYPFFFNAHGSYSIGHLQVDLIGNARISPTDFNATLLRYDDVIGELVTTFDRGTFTTRIVPTLTLRRDRDVSDPFNRLQLNRVAMLAAGSGADGRNLRLETAFEGQGTRVVTFVRPVTVNVEAGSQTVTLTSGTVNVADVGRPIVIDRAGEAGAAFTGVISAVTGPTEARVMPAASIGIGITASGLQARIGENEPDANYLLTLGCNAAEGIGWLDKRATGFTLTSSNPHSTAVCDVVIVR